MRSDTGHTRWISTAISVMRMANGRLLKVVMIEALELGNKVKWVKDLHQSLEPGGVWVERVGCRDPEWVGGGE